MLFRVTCPHCVGDLVQAARITSTEMEILVSHLDRSHPKSYRPKAFGDVLALFDVQRICPEAAADNCTQ